MERSRILDSFVEFFRASGAIEEKKGRAEGPGEFDDSPHSANSEFGSAFDLSHELLGQFPGSSWKSIAPHVGLFLGCPLSNDRRELTSETLLWCPNGWPQGVFVALASSRLGSRLWQDPTVADAIRNFFILSSTHETIVAAEKTTLDLPTRRGCQLFGRAILRLVPFPEKPLCKNWLAASLKSKSKNEFEIYFDSSSISADALTFAICDQVRVVHVRKGGQIWNLICKHSPDRPGPTIMSFVDDGMNTGNRQTLRDHGCVDWYLCKPDAADLGPTNETGPLVESRSLEFLTPKHLDGDFLSHWTRTERKPWPDQTEHDQFDRLFLNHDCVGSPLDTLSRILVQQKLLASGRLVRGGQRVVCFTEVPLSEFGERRVFRPQLSRWDFEPYGIAIRRSVVEQLAGKRVRYVTNDVFEAAESGSRLDLVVNSQESKVDWSMEREWRVAGDIDLRNISPNDAVVFVPDEASAEVIEGFSRWPIVILDRTVKSSPDFGPVQ